VLPVGPHAQPHGRLVDVEAHRRGDVLELRAVGERVDRGDPAGPGYGLGERRADRERLDRVAGDALRRQRATAANRSRFPRAAPPLPARRGGV
jgi:hypothetical protein